MLFLIFLLTEAVNLGGDVLRFCDVLLEDSMEYLKCEVEELNTEKQQLRSEVEELIAENQLLKMSIEQNQNSLNDIDAGLSFCTLNPCGQCACHTDDQLRLKYYCNCGNLLPMRDCLEFRDNGHIVSGLYLVTMGTLNMIEVFCDQYTDGGGWTVIQRRHNGETNFFRGWSWYKEGFGTTQGEFWLGNENIHLLTNQSPEGSELRIDIEDWSDKNVHAQYTTFFIDNEEKKYKLHVSGFTGNAGDSLIQHDGHMFSTYDADNDVYGDNCAATFNGAWWYSACHKSNLNGEYRWYGETVPFGRGVIWRTYKHYRYSMKFVEMKVRRKD